MGLKAYRFSVAWTRILPNGVGDVNEKGVAYYRDVIRECKKNGIEPIITMYHFDLPYCLEKKGGWQIGNYTCFVNMRKFCFRILGKK